MTTVAPALQQFWALHGGTKAMVIEDTSIPGEGVMYKKVLMTSADSEAKPWGYGHYDDTCGAWWGSKGMTVTEGWTAKLMVILEFNCVHGLGSVSGDL